MSSTDIETVHQHRDGEQQTTKRVHYDGDVFEFTGTPGGEFEYAGEKTAPAEVINALTDHVGTDEDVVDSDQEATDDNL